MNFDIKEVSDSAIEITPTTNIERGGIIELQKICKDHCDAGKINLEINLKNVSYLDSAALGILVGLKTMVGTKSGSLKLSDLNPSLHPIFKAMRLDAVFGMSL